MKQFFKAMFFGIPVLIGTSIGVAIVSMAAGAAVHVFLADFTWSHVLIIGVAVSLSTMIGGFPILIIAFIRGDIP